MNAHDRLVDALSTDGRSALEIRTVAVRDERMRISRELHDGIAQHLVLLGYLLDELSAAEDDPSAISTTVTAAQHHVDMIRAELQNTLDELRAPGGQYTERSDTAARDPAEALIAYARETGRRNGLDVRIARDVARTRHLSGDTATELTRIGREAITNVARHAMARTLWLTITLDPPLARVEVADDGIGTRHSGPQPGRYGLTIMAERAQRIGATLRIGERPGGGTIVTVSTGEETADDRARRGDAGR